MALYDGVEICKAMRKMRKGKRMSEQEVKIFMDENGRLYVVTENGYRYILVPYEKNGVFAE